MKCMKGSPRKTMGCWDVTDCDSVTTQSCGIDLAVYDNSTASMVCQLPNVRGCDHDPSTQECQCYTLQPLKWRMGGSGGPNAWVHKCGDPVRAQDQALCNETSDTPEFLWEGKAQEECQLEKPVEATKDDFCDVPGCCIPGGFQPDGGSTIGCRGC